MCQEIWGWFNARVVVLLGEETQHNFAATLGHQEPFFARIRHTCLFSKNYFQAKIIFIDDNHNYNSDRHHHLHPLHDNPVTICTEWLHHVYI